MRRAIHVLRRGGPRRGFTLIEVLLVLAILATVSAIVLPSFVRSIRGNRLRTAARLVVMAGRYARSMAVLQQVDMGVTFDLDGGTIAVVPTTRAAAKAAAAAEGGADAPDRGATGAVPAQAEPPPEAESRVVAETSLTRTLDRVKITRVDVTVAEEDAPVPGTTTNQSTVVYFTNGTCQPYRVRLADESGSVVLITVDALSAATTENEDEPP